MVRYSAAIVKRRGIILFFLGALAVGCGNSETPQPAAVGDLPDDMTASEDTSQPEDVAGVPNTLDAESDDAADVSGADLKPPSDAADTSLPKDVVDPPDVPATEEIETPDAMDAESQDAESQDVSSADVAPEPDVPEVIEPPDCSSTGQLALYSQYIEPLLSGTQPSSCNQCHLSGIDLSLYAKGTPCATMGCLLQNDMVDFDNPAASGILGQIKQADPASELIDDTVIAAEFDGFLEWIQYSAVCHEEVCGEQESPCQAGEPLPTAAGVPSPLGACDEPNIIAAFQDRVMLHQDRCHGCHTNCKPDWPAPCWLVEDYDPTDPDEAKQAALVSMYSLLGIGAVDMDSPEQSLMILKPLAKSAGGVEHGGGDKFYDEADSTWQDYTVWIDNYVACHGGSEPQKPVVDITFPFDKAKIYENQTVNMFGKATDLQQAEIPDEKWVWTSSKLDEPVAIGPGIHNISGLPLGKHILKLTVTDSDGNSGFRAVKIWIKAVPGE